MSAEPAEFSACGVCGRTILRGERITEYVTRDGERVGVCQLCVEDAEAAGWMRSDVASEREPERPRRSPAAFIRERLGRRRAEAPAAPEPALAAAEIEEPAPEPTPQLRPAPPSTPEQQLRRALDAFNASGEPHKIAGLAKALGTPEASVRIGPDGQGVLVVIAWELSWYRWQVDAEGEVRQLAHGDVLEELPEADRRWNAAAEENGRLRVEPGT